MDLPTIIIMGPTGVGKSDFAEQLAHCIGGEIINCDVGQFYTPLTIGTAKPAWRMSAIPHHMFDILDEPENYSVTAYRAALETLTQEIKSRGKFPIIVGGSGFYVHGLFFAPQNQPETACEATTSEPTWQKLFEIDPDRAQNIHPHDHYRIERALQLWKTTGILPSQQKPLFAPMTDNFLLIHITRERTELYERINTRTLQMLTGSEFFAEDFAGLDLDSGWLAEVATLPSAWHEFLVKKGIIGYPEIIDFLQQEEPNPRKLVAGIQKKTRNYAKRQVTYWRMLAHKLQELGHSERILEVNLTLSPVDLYLRQLQKKISNPPF